MADASWIVPFARHKQFFGREAELNELESKIFTKQHIPRIAITGAGGVGKTKLVLEALYRIKERHNDCTVVWISATTFASLEQGYQSAAQQLKVSGHENNKADMKQLVQNHLNREDSGRWLLVFDNVTDVEMWTVSANQMPEGQSTAGAVPLNKSGPLLDYLPTSKLGCVIFTMRDAKAAAQLVQRNIIAVPEMSEDAATQWLKSEVKPSLTANARDITSFLAPLRYIPLAIMLAAAHADGSRCWLPDYTSLFERKQSEAVAILDKDVNDDGRDVVATTCLISFEEIWRSHPLSAEYLSFMACIHPHNIPQSLLPPGPSPQEQKAAIDILDAYALVSRRPETSALDVHPLVHSMTRNWLRKENLLIQCSEKAIIHLNNIFPRSETVDWDTWRLYIPHAIEAVASADHVSQRDAQVAQVALMKEYGPCLLGEGRTDEAEKALTGALALAGEVYTEQDGYATSIRAWLALAYQNQERWKEAEELQLQVMAAYKVKVGEDHSNTLLSMTDLASTYWRLERYEDAEALNKQLIKIQTAKLGANHPSTLLSMSNLATTYSCQGRSEDAERLYKDVAERRKTALGADHPDTLGTLTAVALQYGEQGRWDEAEKLNVELVKTSMAKLGPDDIRTLLNKQNLVTTYRNQNRYEEAEKLGKEVVEGRQAKQGEDHPDTLACTYMLAYLWKLLGRDTEAIELMRACVERRNRVLGPEHPYTVSSAEALRDWEISAAPGVLGFFKRVAHYVGQAW